MKRWIWRVPVFLLIGAIINVAVAWGCVLAAGRPSLPTTTPSASALTWPVPVTCDREPTEYGVTTRPGVKHEVYTASTKTRFLLPTWAAAWRYQQSAPAPKTWFLSDSPLAASSQPSDTMQGHCGVDPSAMLWVAGVRSAGWPAKTLKSAGGNTVVPTPRSLRGLKVPDWIDRGKFNPDRLLPLTPIWSGMATNTALYASVLFALAAAPGHIRRIIRTRQARCTACAYPIGPSPVCTECGRPLEPQTQGGI